MVDWQQEYSIGKFTFSLMEIRDLTISVLILGMIFSVALPSFQIEQSTPFMNFLIAIVIVGPALLFHELAHKLTAQKYGCRAIYVIWPMGIMLSVFLTLITAGNIIFAALGAVAISTSYTTRVGYKFVGLSSQELGKIAASGPFTNMVIAVIAYIFMWINPQIFQAIVSINLIVALFNLVPFPPLDGAKIFSWRKLTWFSMLLSVIVLLYLPPFIGVIASIGITILLLVVIFILLQLSAPKTYSSPYRMP